MGHGSHLAKEVVLADLGRAGEKSDFLSILLTVRYFGQRGKYSSL